MQASGLMLGGRSEPRRSVLEPCYISAIKVSISRFNCQKKSKTSFPQLSDVSKACESTPPNEACWVTDTMPVVKETNKVKETYKEQFKTVIKFTLPTSTCTMSIEVLVLRIDLEMKEDNLRHECTCKVQNKRCCPMKNDKHFFRDIKNKQHLFSLFETYFFTDDFVQPSPLPING